MQYLSRKSSVLLLLSLLGFAGCGSSGQNAVSRATAYQAYEEGVVALDSKNYPSAQEKLTAAIDSGLLNPDTYVQSVIQRATAIAAQGDLETASTQLDELEKNVQDLAEFYAVRSYILTKQGKKRQAKAAWTKARRIRKNVKKITD